MASTVDDWFRLEWSTARLAGELEDEIKENYPLALEKKYGAKYTVRDFSYAKHFLKKIKDEWSLEELRADLRKLHS